MHTLGATRTNESTEFREHLTVAFEQAATWRSELGCRHPNDVRYQLAENELYRLAETVKDIPDAMMEKYITFSLGSGDVDEGMKASECQREMIRAVGFCRCFADATQFLRELVRER